MQGPYQFYIHIYIQILIEEKSLNSKTVIQNLKLNGILHVIQKMLFMLFNAIDAKRNILAQLNNLIIELHCTKAT